MKARTNNSKLYLLLATIILSAALLVSALTLNFSSAKYVTEIPSDGGFDYETQMPADIKTQQDLYNAVTSGYEYVKLSDELKGSLMMTGEEMKLVNNLVIDLNGKEITRNDRSSLLEIPDDKTLTIIDTGKEEAADPDGGLYNPIGSVLTVNGGNLTVYGGKFESGPRTNEYFSIEYPSAKPEIKTVTELNRETGEAATVEIDGKKVAKTISMPAFVLSGGKTSDGLYFDTAYAPSGITQSIARDTYVYMATSEGLKNELASLDMKSADYAYKYRINADGTWYSAANEDLNNLTDAEKADLANTREVIVMAYIKDIETSAKANEKNNNAIPNYAAVKMLRGRLNVDVKIEEKKDEDGNVIPEPPTGAGSFYSYFGTWNTYCIFMQDGEMNVSTSGELKTVDPETLPVLVSGENASNSAKYGENACIMSAGGVLNITKVKSLQSYNGSAISVSGGSVDIVDTSVTKTATLSHSDDPFFADVPFIDPDTGKEDPSRPTQFPAARQYRDAALFVNGGTLTLTSVSVDVEKTLTGIKQPYHASGADYPQTSFGILSRGRTQVDESGQPVGLSSLEGTDLKLDMHGDYSYGIYATRGEVKLTGTETQAAANPMNEIILDSDVSCYGVYAVNKVNNLNSAKILLKNYKIHLGEEKTYVGENPRGLVSGRRIASVGVYLDSTVQGGSVTLDKTEIHSQEMGVAVDGGALTFQNGGKIHAYNASAIGLRGGNITFDSAEPATGSTEPHDYEIICRLNKQQNAPEYCKVSDSKIADAVGTHQYGIYLPWQVKTDEQLEQMLAAGTITEAEKSTYSVSVPTGKIQSLYENTNGIRVIGGELISSADANLVVSFTGLFNDYDMYDVSGAPDDVYFDNVVIKSFAVACAKDKADASISIQNANITSEIGGGIKVDGGTIVLGSGTTVYTKGHNHWGTRKYVRKDAPNNNWDFYPNLGGGHAVVARNGKITINGGEYKAEYGNGVAATGNGASVTINDGKFIGKLEHNGNNKNSSGDRVWGYCYDRKKPWGTMDPITNQTGPGSHYGLKVMGKATVEINGGEFDGENGGAFIRGADENNRALVKVKKGNFGTTTECSGQDGFSVMDYCEVYVGTNSALDQSLIHAQGVNYAISLNPLDGSVGSYIDFYIYYGKYETTYNGATKNSGMLYIDGAITEVNCYAYNYGSTSGTTFVGHSSAGYYFDAIRFNGTTPPDSVKFSWKLTATYPNTPTS